MNIAQAWDRNYGDIEVKSKGYSQRFKNQEILFGVFFLFEIIYIYEYNITNNKYLKEQQIDPLKIILLKIIKIRI